ncbi:MAG: NAD-dependent epimerase/dehydratase family protein [Streptosporangiaceae bacterium]
MRLLVLGGTRFLGRAIVDEAIRRGYDVTTFSRGLSGEPRPGAEALHGDRTNSTDLLRVAERDFDLVIDTSVIAPRHVAASARLLAPRVRHYTYVSTLSVYPDHGEAPVSEESTVVDGSPDADGTEETLGYRELKVGSERAVAEALPGRHLIVRPGLIVGPHENIGRLPWWLTRIARGGTVLAPGDPGRPVRMTDARDLAAWLVDNTRRGIPGVVNVPGPEGTTFGELLTDCGQATAADRGRAGAAGPDAGAPGGAGAGQGGPGLGGTLQLRWVPDRVLLEAGVEPWSELPMWAPDTPEFAAVWNVTGDRALRTGIRYRPLSDTVRDTWAWLRRDVASRGPDTFERRPGIGLDPAKEQDILASLE